jgi:ATP-dependent DNA helicase RecG
MSHVPFSGGKEKSKEISNEKSREKVLRGICEDPTITISGLAHLLGLSVGGVEINIRLLKSEGLIRRVGSDTGGHWKITKSN